MRKLLYALGFSLVLASSTMLSCKEGGILGLMSQPADTDAYVETQGNDFNQPDSNAQDDLLVLPETDTGINDISYSDTIDSGVLEDLKETKDGTLANETVNDVTLETPLSETETTSLETSLPETEIPPSDLKTDEITTDTKEDEPICVLEDVVNESNIVPIKQIFPELANTYGWNYGFFICDIVSNQDKMYVTIHQQFELSGGEIPGAWSMLSFDGENWNKITVPYDTTKLGLVDASVWISKKGNLFFSGTGVFAKYTPGQEWEDLSSTLLEEHQGVIKGVSENEIYMVNKDGVYLFDGTKFEKVLNNPSFDIDISNSTIFVAGQGKVMINKDSNWITDVLTNNNWYWSRILATKTSAYFSTDHGPVSLFKYDGTNWIELGNLENQIFDALDLIYLGQGKIAIIGWEDYNTGNPNDNKGALIVKDTLTGEEKSINFDNVEPKPEFLGSGTLFKQVLYMGYFPSNPAWGATDELLMIHCLN